jgi:hypothetical protein
VPSHDDDLPPGLAETLAQVDHYIDMIAALPKAADRVQHADRLLGHLERLLASVEALHEQQHETRTTDPVSTAP